MFRCFSFLAFWYLFRCFRFWLLWYLLYSSSSVLKSCSVWIGCYVQMWMCDVSSIGWIVWFIWASKSKNFIPSSDISKPTLNNICLHKIKHKMFLLFGRIPSISLICTMWKTCMFVCIGLKSQSLCEIYLGNAIKVKLGSSLHVSKLQQVF